MYKIIRFFLFLLPAETSHKLGLVGLQILYKLKLSKLFYQTADTAPLSLFGIEFPNSVGLAAGLDKNGDYIDALGALGFGFIEVGTITPLAQPGNPGPRMFRLPEKEAIINRMGFNNKGVDHLLERLKTRKFKGPVGVNIGKNLSTPVGNALDDYLICLRKVFAYADYIVINLSSPNTPGLRSLQFGEPLNEMLASLKQEQARLELQTGKKTPLLVKIAPDLNPEEIDQIADSFLQHKIEGIIATNTTISREQVENLKHGQEQGGLSGAILAPMSTQVLERLNTTLKGAIPVIGVGGINDSKTAVAKMNAGASLVQLYTGFIYHGPMLIEQVKNAINIDSSEKS